MHHAFWTHDGAAQRPAKLGRGNWWVIVGIVVRLPFCSHPVCLPILFRLWAGKGTASPVQLARQMLAVLRKAFPHQQIHAVGDAAYHGRPLLVAATTITIRLPTDAALCAPAPPPPTTAADPPREATGCPAVRPGRHRHRYGRLDTVVVAVIDALWYGAVRRCVGPRGAGPRPRHSHRLPVHHRPPQPVRAHLRALRSLAALSELGACRTQGGGRIKLSVEPSRSSTA